MKVVGPINVGSCGFGLEKGEDLAEFVVETLSFGQLRGLSGSCFGFGSGGHGLALSEWTHETELVLFLGEFAFC